MARSRQICGISLLLSFVVLAGCGGNVVVGSGQGTGNSSVVLAMTDLPPTQVTVLSAEVTLTGATLTPGNVSLFSGSMTVDLARLQTDVAYLATATKTQAGAYTAVTLTFANPKLTFENDTASTLAGCAVGSICTFAPSASNLSATVPLSSFTIASNSAIGLLVDVSLDSLLSNTLGEDFSAGTAVTSFTPAGIGAPLVGAEDVVGQVTAVNASTNTFTLQNATATYSLKVDSSSTFFQFPTSACAAAGFSCLQASQILSLDIGIQSDGSISARNILFEDANNSDAEIEGMVTNTNAGSLQFDIVIQSMSAAVTGLSLGERVTVQYSASPQTPFDIDFVHADNLQVSTGGFLFAAPSDLTVGQEVSVRLHSILSGGQIMADRVRLRSTRITATLQTNGSSTIGLSSPPSIFSGHGVTTLLAQTPTQTICSENKAVKLCSTLTPFLPVSVRGPLFNVSGTRTIVSTRVVEKQ